MNATTQTEADLWAAYSRDRSVENRNAIAMANRGLIGYVIRRCFRQHDSVIHQQWDDALFQEGFIGLLGAVERFDQSNGAKFSTFACHTIWGALRSRVDRENGSSVKARNLMYWSDAMHPEYIPGEDPEDFWEHELNGLIPEDRETLTNRFRRGQELSEMSRETGISHQGMSLRVKRAITAARAIREAREKCTRTA